MAKITFIGAGSVVFTQGLITDFLLAPELHESTICLMDIDAERLGVIESVTRRMFEQHDCAAKIQTTLDQREALDGADYVFNMVQVGRERGYTPDIQIPLKYGVKQCIGDTLGPGGVFRFLRTAPIVIEMTTNMQQLCPDALLINYSNPLAMVCWLISRCSSIRHVGLCCSTNNTMRKLCKLLGAPQEDTSYSLAGINHMSWVLRLEHKGQDLYPKLREMIDDEVEHGEDRARYETFRRFGYFPSEGTTHHSEYLPYYRRNDALLEKYCTEGFGGETGLYFQFVDMVTEAYDKVVAQLATGERFELVSSLECIYAMSIIHAMETGEPAIIYGNVPNTGLITNLPEGCCVEIQCLVDGSGIKPCYVGALPPQCAALNRTNINVQEVAVQAALDADPALVYQAVALDPLTASVLSLDEIDDMVKELFEAEREFLPQFSSKSSEKEPI